MSELPAIDKPGLEVISPDCTRRFVFLTVSPFCIGRGESGNHLQLAASRISRQFAALISEGDLWYLEDRGHRRGVFVSGKQIDRCELKDGDIISFGIEDSYEIIFRSSGADTSIQNILSRIQDLPSTGSSPGGLHKLNLLLEATMLLHSQLPLDSVLSTMLDHAISITDADRGLLLEPDSSGALRVRLAARRGGLPLSPDSLAPSQTALRQALKLQASVITEDLNLADLDLQGAQSIVAQRLRAVIAIPLYAMHRASSTESAAYPNRG